MWIPKQIVLKLEQLEPTLYRARIDSERLDNSILLVYLAIARCALCVVHFGTE